MDESGEIGALFPVMDLDCMGLLAPYKERARRERTAELILSSQM